METRESSEAAMGLSNQCKRWLTSLGLIVLTMVLSGCSNVFSAQLTRYQQWPEQTVGAYYWIAPDATQQNNLQFQTYADTVRAAMGSAGLVEAQSQAQARFIVHMDYVSQEKQGWRQETVDPFFYSGAYGRGFGLAYPWMSGQMVQSVPVVFTEYRLSVRLDDQNQQGREVYRASATTRGQTGQQGAVMPYLARALFDQFPGRNGQEIQVRYPLN
ncbi:DUF4136 domain-containing protein [Castellaniella sp.]|uniref:DUF4136 domain-containing protein n=1 Tax=Castellaniella sp. TaxID=1955812 RepID=UPI002AFF8682|nr:DUF4136 domain-containing protein [Castellaniella sp.]